MLTSPIELIEPSDETFEFGYNLHYKSRYDFVFYYRGKESRAEFHSQRKEFDRYPVFLKHTLLHPDGLNKVRNADFGNAFFVFDDLKTEGNLYYEDQDYYSALEFYEQVPHLLYQFDRHTAASSGQSSRTLSGRTGSLRISSLNQYMIKTLSERKRTIKGMNARLIHVFSRTEVTKLGLAAVVNILLNMCCVYMKLSHYNVALQCCDEIIKLTNLSAEAYYRRSQVRIYNLKSSYKDLDLAEEDITTALTKKPEEQKYRNHLEILRKRRFEKFEEDKKFVEDMVACAKKCMEFKKSKEIMSNATLVEVPQEIRIMRVVKRKYADCMEFFRDTEDNKQVLLTVKDFREFSITSYQKMMKYFKFNPAMVESQLLQELPVETKILLNDEGIQGEINNIKVREALMLFGEGHINFDLFQYATKLVFKEDKKRKEAMEKRQKDLMGTKEKNPAIGYGKLAIYGVVVSILLYVLWNWIMWKFYWAGKDEYMFGKKPGFQFDLTLFTIIMIIRGDHAYLLIYKSKVLSQEQKHIKQFNISFYYRLCCCYNENITNIIIMARKNDSFISFPSVYFCACIYRGIEWRIVQTFPWTQNQEESHITMPASIELLVEPETVASQF
eukprot:TRINITY_DN1062_c0_g1_i1.p1 TRINITY_DN1062_c0_g1~~TRINITY_DN1062_c0_g1_i1.p1  ORF type:complete len:613 (+),score=43.02 TRINITY_DN1062_c0_g1_i1:449-2287(+)